MLRRRRDRPRTRSFTGRRLDREGDRFDQDFDRDLVTTFRELTGARKIFTWFGVVLMALGLLPNLYPLLLIGLLIVIVCLVTRRRHPPDPLPGDDAFEALDRERDLEDCVEYVASGAGARAYERFLSELQALVGREVTVITGTGGADWGPVMRVTGPLLAGQRAEYDPSYEFDAVPVDDLDRELLFFAVGDTNSGFFVDKPRFVRGEADVQRGEDDALVLVTTDTTVRIYASTSVS